MIFFFVSLSTYFCFLVLKYRNGLLDFETCDYSSGKYGSYILKNIRKLFVTPEILVFALIIVLYNVETKIDGICMVVFYCLLSLFMIKKLSGKFIFDKNKVLVILFSLLVYICLFTFFILDYNYLMSGYFIYERLYLYYIILALIGYFSPLVLLLGGFVTGPLRKKRKLKKK